MTGVFREAEQIVPAGTAIVVHAERAWADHILRGENLFFEKLGKLAASRGLVPLLTRAEEILSPLMLEAGGLHVMMGPKRHQGENIFHAHPSYLRGFWYLDTKGYFWNSSIRDKQFSANSVDAEAADKFLAEVFGHLNRNNLSKRPQPARLTSGVKPGAALVVIQDIEKYSEQIHYLKSRAMIRNVSRATDRTVYVKLHPLLSETKRRDLTNFCNEIERVEVIEASVHELIGAVDVVVTQNSAVGVEAIMHQKPVLTCAKTDYHRGSIVCRSGAELRENFAYAREFADTFPFAKYFYWLMHEQMLRPNQEDFALRAAARLFA